jgi:hypothetical protein
LLCSKWLNIATFQAMHPRRGLVEDWLAEGAAIAGAIAVIRHCRISCSFSIFDHDERGRINPDVGSPGYAMARILFRLTERIARNLDTPGYHPDGGGLWR